jgi:hypothetical protein
MIQSSLRHASKMLANLNEITRPRGARLRGIAQSIGGSPDSSFTAMDKPNGDRFGDKISITTNTRSHEIPRRTTKIETPSKGQVPNASLCRNRTETSNEPKIRICLQPETVVREVVQQVSAVLSR